MKTKLTDTLTRIDLKAGDFNHVFPEDINFELCVQYKRGNIPNDFVSPLESVERIGDIIKVNNRVSEYCYNYSVKGIKNLFLIPM